MVEMAMRIEKVGVDLAAFLQQLAPELPYPCAGVENEEMFAAANLKARRIAAISDRLRSRTGNTSPDPPKANREFARLPHVLPTPRPRASGRPRRQKRS